MQPQLVLNVGPALMPDFATGANFHAIVAWPTADEMGHFHRVSEELMAGTLRMTMKENPVLARSIMSEWPQFNWRAIEARSHKAKPALGYLEKRLNQRMASARAGIGKIHEQLFGRPAILPPGMTATSIDQLCNLIASDVWIDDPHNIERLVWRRSLPILHVAIAAQLLLSGRFADRAKFGCELHDVQFYREAVLLGQLLEGVIDEHPEISVTREQMTLIRWFE